MAPTKGIQRPVSRVLALLDKAGIPTKPGAIDVLLRRADVASGSKAFVLTGREAKAIVEELRAMDASTGTPDAKRKRRAKKVTARRR